MKVKLTALLSALFLAGCQADLPAINAENIASAIAESSVTTAPQTTVTTATTADPLETGQVIHIYITDEKYAELIGDVYELPDGFSYKFTAVEKNYSKELLDTLKDNEELKSDERIDLFLTDFDYMRRFVESDYSLPLDSIGITADDTAKMYPYTIAYGSDESGAVKALTWFVSPDVFVFRRSIAEDCLFTGKANPDSMAEAIADWDTLTTTANFLYIAYSGRLPDNQAYQMFTSGAEFYRPFMQNTNEPLVTDNIFNYPERWHEFRRLHMLLTNRRYVGRVLPNTDEWRAEMRMDGMTLAFIGSKDFIDGVLTEEASSEGDDGTFGDWAVCRLPEQSVSGGVFLSAAKGSDNLDIAADIIKAVTCNAETLRELDVIPNNMDLVEEYSKSDDYASAMLGGQNPYSVFNAAAKDVPTTDMTEYNDFGRIYAYNEVGSYINRDIDGFDALETYINRNYRTIKVPFEEDPKYVKPGVAVRPDTSLL
ncbi:MAG: ABC transporter substrate-binding protein [Ruminococcus sp.]|jgi:hypothetical protein|nr:ABC transporter substrate-binding protein [Ruminococcus sp.]